MFSMLISWPGVSQQAFNTEPQLLGDKGLWMHSAGSLPHQWARGVCTRVRVHDCARV